MDGDEESGRDISKSSRRESLILGYAAENIQVQSRSIDGQSKARRASDDLIATSERSQLIIKPTGKHIFSRSIRSIPKKVIFVQFFFF